MSENCSHNCSECGSDFSKRTVPQSLLEPLNKNSSVKRVIGVVSGKGGVGKFLVTAMLAVLNQRKVLHPSGKPEVCFALCEGDEVEAVYAYCNLYSLWKA
jgi:desulfoferrodoxin (superoxide reductase-like protein)